MISNPKHSPHHGGRQGVPFFPLVVDPRGLVRPAPPGLPPFPILFPVRRIPPKRKSTAGKVPFPHLGRSIGFESTYERDFLLICRGRDSGFAIIEQPLTLDRKALGFGKGPYTPDYLIWTWGPAGLRTVTLVEVKPEEVFWDDFKKIKSKAMAGVRFAKRQGWRFRLITDRHLRLPLPEKSTWPEIHAPVRQLLCARSLFQRLFGEAVHE